MAFLPSPQNISSQGASGGVTKQAWQGPGDGWFVWTCPTTDAYYFSTRGSGTDFKTTVTAYAVVNWPPRTSADYSAVTPLRSGDFGGEYGYEFGALTAFNATAGAEYFINVGSRDGKTTGKFTMEFGKYVAETIGACGKCTPASTGLCKVDSFIVGDVTLPNAHAVFVGGIVFPYASIGVMRKNYKPGKYVLNYCSGAFYQGSYGSWFTMTSLESPLFLMWSNTSATFKGAWPGGPFHYVLPSGYDFTIDSYSKGDVVYSYDGDAPEKVGIFVANQDVPSSIHYNSPHSRIEWDDAPNCEILDNSPSASSQALAEQAAACFSFEFCHAGGEICFGWFNYTSQTGSINGNPNPNFALLYFDLQQIVKLSVYSIQNNGYTNGTDRSGGFKYAVTLSVSNSSLNYSTGNFSLRMLAQDGNTVASTATVSLNVAAASSDTSNASWNFYTQNTDALPATFRIYDCAGNFVCDVPLVLAEASASVVGTLPDGEVICSTGVLAPSRSSLTVRNYGVVPITNLVLQMQSVISGAVQFSDPSNGTPCSGPFSRTLFSKAIGYLEPFSLINAQVITAFAMQRADATLGVGPSGGPPSYQLDVKIDLADKANQFQMPTLTQTASLQ